MVRVPLVVEPDEDYPGCATVLVDGAIAGRPYRFVLDTGAARTHVVADDHLGTLPSHGTHHSAGVVGARSEDLVVLPDLVVGPITMTGLEVSRTADGDRNLLGIDVIGSAAARFDVAGEAWEVRPTGTLPTAWPLDRSPRGHPFVDVVWPGVTARACWDTGAGITVVDTGFLARHPELFRFTGTAVGTDATGARVEGPTYLVERATIGGLTFAPHPAAAVDLPQHNGRMDLVLGYPVLRQAVWTFDFPARRWGVSLHRAPPGPGGS